VERESENYSFARSLCPVGDWYHSVAGCDRYPVLPIDSSDIVDTVGAGDAFAGGFLARFMTGADTAACVAAGAYASNYILRRRCCSIDVNEPPQIDIDHRRRVV